MWIQQVNDKFIAIAYNPEKNVSMPMSKPRTSYDETLQWVRKWCGTFCILPVWLIMLTGILVLVAYSLGAAQVLLIQHFLRKWKTIAFVLRPTTDVWPFGMRNPKQRLRTNWYSIASTINSVGWTLKKSLLILLSELWTLVIHSSASISLGMKKLASYGFWIKHENVGILVVTLNGILWLILSFRSITILTSKRHKLPAIKVTHLQSVLVVWQTLSPSDSSHLHSTLPSILDLSTPKMTHKTIAMPAMVRYHSLGFLPGLLVTLSLIDYEVCWQLRQFFWWVWGLYHSPTSFLKCHRVRTTCWAKW